MFRSPAIALLLLSTSAAAQDPSWLESRLSHRSFGGTVSVNEPLFRGLRMAVRYHAEASPSYAAKLYTRLDQYAVSADVAPGQLLNAGSPIGISFGAGTEITFARQFEKQRDAITALPYGFDHLPLSARTALTKLTPGDYASFTTRMNVTGAAGIGLPIAGPVVLSAGARMGISGEFQVQVYRMKNGFARVRLLATSGRSSGVAASLGAYPNFQLFQLQAANNAVNAGLASVLPLSPVSVSAEHGRSEVCVLDYVYDLSRSEAAAAYDALMGGKLIAAGGEAAHLLQLAARDGTDGTQPTKAFLNDLGPTEALAARDRELRPALRAVDRVFDGSDDMRYARAGVRLDLKVASIGENDVLADEHITVTSRDGADRRFLYQSAKSERSANLGFGTFSWQENTGAGLLANADADFHATSGAALALTRELRASDVRTPELERELRHLRASLPPAMGARAEQDLLSKARGSANLRDVYLKTEIYLDPRAVTESLRLPEAELFRRFKAFVKERFSKPGGQGWDEFDGEAYAKLETRVPGLSRPAFCKVIACFERDFAEIASRLALALRDDVPAADRLRHFQALESFPIIREAGAGFLVSLLPEDRAESLLRVRTRLFARGLDPASFEAGQISDEDALKAFQVAQEIIFNRSVDLRLYENAHGERTASTLDSVTAPVAETNPQAHDAR